MPDLEPITREEMLLDGDDLTPITRKEKFIKRIYDKTQEIPEPITREEMFLKKAGEGGGGDIDLQDITITENGEVTAPSGVAYKKITTNVPLPQNAYLKKTATTSMSDAEQLPVASAKVSVTDKDKAELFLTSDGVVSEDNTPYTYRPSPSGKSCVDLSVVGGTVAWNQQLSLSNLPSDSALYSNTTYTVNGVTFTKNNDGSITIQTESGGATSEASVKIGNDARLEFIKNHIHYIPRCKGGSASTYYFNYAGSRYVYDNDKIFAKQPSGFNMWLIVKQGTVITTPVKVYPQVVDLEQMFGSTIANYIYSLEEATAGSGIAWLKSNGFLTKDYYPYDSGSLQSVKTSARKVVGKNIASVNSVTAGSGNIDIYNGVGIQSNITISFKCNNFSFTNAGASLVVIIDSDNQAHPITPSGFGLSVNTVYNNRVSGSFTINYKFKRIYIPTTGYTNISGSLDDIQIELGSTATNYEPYKTTTYPLDSDLTLRGIVKKDANNNIYYDGDIYKSDGSVKRKYGIVNLGDLTYTFRSGNYFEASLPLANTANNIPAICSKYNNNLTITGWADLGDKEFAIRNTVLRIKDTSYSDESTFKTAMQNANVQLAYLLSTPTTESATPFTNPQLVGSTEEFIDTRDVAIPVGQDSKYVNGNIYIKYLDSVTTGDIELADENAIIPLENTTYISSNGSASIDYWSKEE